MKRFFTTLAIIIAFLNLGFSQQCDNVVAVITPTNYTVSTPITLSVTLACPDMAWTLGDLYLWAWVVPTVGANIDNPLNGTWAMSNPLMKLTKVGNAYTYVFTPTQMIPPGAPVTIGKIGYLLKTQTGAKEDCKTKDMFIDFTPAGVNEVASGLKVMPNPSNGVFNVNVDKNYSLQVADITGKIVLNQELSTSANSVDLTNFSNGIYFFRLSNDATVETFKVIKN